ncbi:hypothetical protein Tdes44962_MAKER07563 [Teratosphaeria destructans]|uniref:Uncharacterized protein n=1 Tax=Teratosphaeria destructans TaxID=418781 RepID=A0A9W7SYJ0_9PEZI|nr:hypothetical protein Tdes44962_MAKER07563 [Teratosphaeria destructans]
MLRTESRGTAAVSFSAGFGRGREGEAGVAERFWGRVGVVEGEAATSVVGGSGTSVAESAVVTEGSDISTSDEATTSSASSGTDVTSLSSANATAASTASLMTSSDTARSTPTPFPHPQFRPVPDIHDALRTDETCYREDELSGLCGDPTRFLDDCAYFSTLNHHIYQKGLMTTHTFKICKGSDVYAMQCNVTGKFWYSYRVVDGGGWEEQGYVGHRHCGRPGRGDVLVQRPVMRVKEEEGWGVFMPLIVIRTGWYLLGFPGQVRRRLQREGFVMVDDSALRGEVRERVRDTWCNARPVYTKGYSEVSLLDLDCDYGIQCNRFPKVDQGNWKGVMVELANVLDDEHPVADFALISFGVLALVVALLAWWRVEARRALRRYLKAKFVGWVERWRVSRVCRWWFDEDDEDEEDGVLKGEEVGRDVEMVAVLPFDEPARPFRYQRGRRTPHGVAGVQRQWYQSSRRCETVAEETEPPTEAASTAGDKEAHQISIVVEEVEVDVKSTDAENEHEAASVVGQTRLVGGEREALIHVDGKRGKGDALATGAAVEAVEAEDEQQGDLFVVGEAEESDDDEVRTTRSVV